MKKNTGAKLAALCLKPKAEEKEQAASHLVCIAAAPLLGFAFNGATA